MKTPLIAGVYKNNFVAQKRTAKGDYSYQREWQRILVSEIRERLQGEKMEFAEFYFKQKIVKNEHD